MSLEPRSPDATDLRTRLEAEITAAISAAGGWIPFSRFMEMALYAPGLGYYSAGARKIGRDPRDGSDFVTAPELTPLFGRSLARPVAEVLAAGGDTILELGGGTGRLAVELLRELEALGRLPARYLILDVSADLRERQRTLVAREVRHLADRVVWIDALPSTIHGIVLGNEVLDALPVELVVFDGDRWWSRGVSRAEGRFVYADRPLPPDLAALIIDTEAGSRARPAGYTTELHPAASALVETLVERLSDDSALLLIDYGFPESEYYHSQRVSGTLMAHRAHRATTALLADVGLQDITAHVDFSAVARAARRAGGTVVGYTNQATFLIGCGIATLLRGSADAPSGWAPQAAALQTLLSEAEMGELFKVIAIAKRPWSLDAFRANDRRVAL
jgi:SAM-dependent MidA family methyltransferase